MARLALVAIDRPEVRALPISDRLRSQLIYFMAVPGAPGVPSLGEDEFWIDRGEVDRWLEDGVLSLVSPLDTANMTEVELSEEQEAMLLWLNKEQVQHVRISHGG